MESHPFCLECFCLWNPCFAYVSCVVDDLKLNKTAVYLFYVVFFYKFEGVLADEDSHWEF